MRRFCLIAFACITLNMLPVLAQSDDAPSVQDIAYDDVVEQTITDAAFYDWWTVDATEGDQLVIDMKAFDGLAPLIGILDGSGNLLTRSEDGQPDAEITLEYTIERDGRYVLVATRVGNADGTTSGSYVLRLRRANAAPQTSPDLYQDVTFICKDSEVTTAATILLADDPRPGLVYRITVYGLDGFDPVIRLTLERPRPYEECVTDAQATLGNTFTLPEEAAQTITDTNIGSVAQVALTGADQAGAVQVTIGSEAGLPGRYLAVIDNLLIDPKNDIDSIEFRIGPLAALATAMTVYMVGMENSRLDPYIRWEAGNLLCDDAGRGDCKGVPSFTGARFTLNDPAAALIGDRSDAGLVLVPGNPDPMLLELSSRSGDTSGGYALIILGELPPR
jgi:hypothetical protein